MRKKTYLQPTTSVYAVATTHTLLAGSFNGENISLELEDMDFGSGEDAN